MYIRNICAFITAVGLHTATAHLIEDFGAVRDDSTLQTALLNSDAIKQAFEAASNVNNEDFVVEIPADSTYHIYSSDIQDVHDVTFQIDGNLIVHDTIEDWPEENGLFVFNFEDSTGLTLTGSGTVDGQGYKWWWATLLNTRAHNYRPNLFEFANVEDCVISGFTTKNSPRFNFHLADMLNLEVFDLTILTDLKKQEEMLRDHGKWHLDLNIPMFPFNTDGIDPAGKNIYIHDVYIENWDDAVAVKPSNTKYQRVCTENVLIENVKVKYGVGISMGSVSANQYHNCINNVTVKNVEFEDPMKAVYIKTNSGGEEGTDSAIVSNIHYENLTIKNPVWYAIYIGPQQMKEPDGAGNGCMLYPIGGDDACPVNPLVPIYNVTLKDIAISGGVTPPVVRCNETAPCTGFEFDNVQYTSWATRAEGWICENAFGTEKHLQPKPCLEQE
jgi:polygalacturonase